MRGIQPSASTMKTPQRITPAHAGNTDIIKNALEAYKDHPRACGEYAGRRGR